MKALPDTQEQKELVSQLETNIWIPRGKDRVGGIGRWDWHIYTIDTMYKIGNYWEHTVQYRELYLMHCGDLNGREVQKEGAIWVSMTDLFCYTVETNITL